ncbi:MAG: DUF721 domain-containing protein [Verrucomicrobia bacterium]|nr:DUF721 domain-containing protein [Kiritimatiellia bacterium]MCB1100917.1 DUF721 domain-containing protein [Kiritimatiellia bacterium]MCP5488477.1 DUF721 domain-containing protein [Verrucomicrobiota bacterium]
MSERRKLSRGQWAVERERFQYPSEIRPESEDRTVPMSEAVNDALKSLGLHRDHTLHQLTEQWPTLAGDHVAKHSRPGAMQGHMLVVYVNHPMWLAELQRGSDQHVLANLKQAGIHTIKRVRFQIDPEMGR